MKTAAWVTTVICGLLAYSCSGTETQNPVNPLLNFKDSGCKKENAAASNSSSSGIATAAQALVSTDYSAETAGMKCFAWEVVDDHRLKIDLMNFEGSCGAEWTGQAAIASDGSLQLSLVNPECRIALCGTCMYDWSFEVEGVDTSKDVAVSLGIDTCPGGEPVVMPIVRASATLPTAAQERGIVCNYADFTGLGWQAMALGQCGTAAMPCTGTNMCAADPAATTTEPTCQGDLLCTDNGNADQRICAKACAADADCGTLGILSCQAGHCRPANRW
jgi:hypothetical protein